MRVSPMLRKNYATCLLYGFLCLLYGFLLSITACSGAMADDLKYHRKPESKMPFSEAVQAGDFLFVSGQIGISANVAPSEQFASAAKNAMDRIERILVAHGSGMEHVVQCTVMLADMSMWEKFNEVYITYFKSERLPARNAFGANGLANGAPVEVACFSYHPQSDARN